METQHWLRVHWKPRYLFKSNSIITDSISISNLIYSFRSFQIRSILFDQTNPTHIKLDTFNPSRFMIYFRLVRLGCRFTFVWRKSFDFRHATTKYVSIETLWTLKVSVPFTVTVTITITVTVSVSGFSHSHSHSYSHLNFEALS